MPEKKTRKAVEPITGAKIVTMDTATGSTPALLVKGDAPEVGAVLRATLDNGVTYSGIVSEVTEADGKVLIEFKSGLAPAA